MTKSRSQKPKQRTSKPSQTAKPAQPTKPVTPPAPKEETAVFWRVMTFLIPLLVATVGVIFAFPSFWTWWTRNDISYEVTAKVPWEGQSAFRDFNPFDGDFYREGFFTRSAALWVEVRVKNTGNKTIHIENLVRGMDIIPEWGNPEEITPFLVRDGYETEQELEFFDLGYEPLAYSRPDYNNPDELLLPITVAPDQAVVFFSLFTVPLSKNYPLMFNEKSQIGPKYGTAPRSILADLLLSYNKFGKRDEWRVPDLISMELLRENDVMAWGYTTVDGEERPITSYRDKPNDWLSYKSPLWIKLTIDDGNGPRKITVIHTED